MDTSTLKYTAPPHTREKNVYLEEYYASPDVKIEISGEEITEASSVEFSLQEQLKPIYGHGSYVFDDVAIGNRIIVGSITVQLKNTTDNVNIDTSIESDEAEIINDSRPGWAINNSSQGSVYYINNNSSNNNATSSTSPILSTIFSYSADIEKAQAQLVQYGYNVNINGYLDLATRKALSEYQEVNSLTITGTLTEETKEALNGSNGNSIVNTECYLLNGPGTMFTKIKKITVGTNVQVMSENDNYYYVSIADGSNKTGYIDKQCITMLQ